MKTKLLFAALLALPLVTLAKSETTRIEIARGKHALVTLTGPATAGQFTIWSGPGTSTTSASAEGTAITPTTARDFADWAAGPVEPPHEPDVLSVRFYCAAAGESARESVPSHLCYGVRYAYDDTEQQGYIQIPPVNDREFPLNGQSIYRGVEGTWYRATQEWDLAVRVALQAARDAQGQTDYSYVQQPIYTPPARSAVSATPKVTPKTR